MKKHVIVVALGTALVALGASPVQALEFQSKGRGLIGSGLSYLMPLPRRGEVRPEAEALSKKQVEEINKGKVDLPKCVNPEGSLRIVEPDDGQSLWASYGLPMPTRMLRSFVTESSCWRVLDRGVGFAAAQAERELASGGHLQGNSNLGGGQMLAADYILIPDIVSQNGDAGGRNFGASGGGSAGGLGRLMFGGGGSSRKQTVAVMLTLVDSRTSEVLATSTGAAEVSDRQWQLMASGSGSNGVASGQGSISAGAYENTEIGTVTRAAYHQAFHQMLFDLEPMDLLARVNAAPQATAQQQPAQVSAYGTGGAATSTTSGAPAQMQLDQHAAHAQIRTQQMQQLHQMHQPAPHPQQMYPQQMYPQQMYPQQQQMQPQQQMQQLQMQQQQQQQMQQQQMQQYPQQSMGMTAGGLSPANLAQAGMAQQMAGQLAGQMLPEGSALLIGAVANGLQQGNLAQGLTQAAVQQLGAQMPSSGTAQLVGAVANGLQQGNLAQGLTQAAVQQLGAQMPSSGTAQLVGAVANGLQQGNLAQGLTQAAVQQLGAQMPSSGTAQLVGAVANGLQQGNLAQGLTQAAVQQFAGTGAAAMGVMVLKVPANFEADASGSGSVVRVLQPGETLARLGVSPQGTMIQVRDGQGVIGWIAANTHADLISTQQ